MRYLSKQLMLAILQAVILCVAAQAQDKPLPDLKIFDSLITRKFVAYGFKKPIKFSFKVIKDGDAKRYASIYQFPRKNKYQHYHCLIDVAPAGSFIDPQKYERRREEFKREHADRGEAYLLHEFPPIGKRAQQDYSTWGPGGSVYGMSFTTSDEKFDVRITISNLLPNNVEMPDFDINEMAKRISDLYDRKPK